MTAYVLDASVAAKWFLHPVRETLTSEALQLLHEYVAGRVRLPVPDLFWSEFGNVLWKAVHQAWRKQSENFVKLKIDTVAVAQLVVAPDCGSGSRGFKSHQPPHF